MQKKKINQLLKLIIMKKGRINERNIGYTTLGGELKIRKSKKVILPKLSDLQQRTLESINEMDLMLKFGEICVHAPENYSETLNHWLKMVW